jgi:ubiquinone biosynthesis protein
MSEQIGWRGFLRTLRQEAPHYATLLPQLPRLLHQRLEQDPVAQIESALRELAEQQRRRNGLLRWMVALLALVAVGGIWLAISRM